jgi:hypothetical protein
MCCLICAGENLAKHIMDVLQEFNIVERVAMLTTDNCANMVKARRIVVSTPGFEHIIAFRYVLYLRYSMCRHDQGNLRCSMCRLDLRKHMG